MEPFIVNVTEADIKAAEGQAGVYNKCPIALALIRLGFVNVDVDEDRILITKLEVPPQRLVSKTPMPASLLIGDFDDDKPVTPLSFTLNKLRPATQADERKKIGEIDSMLLGSEIDEENE
jgi:hypothetical protein